jgi:hypothetical protein
MKTKLISVLTAMTVIAFAGITSCSRPDETEDIPVNGDATIGGRANLEVRLMDAPSYDYEMVNVNITGLSIYIVPEATGERERWYELSASTGNYNLLSLVNGKYALLANQYVPPGRITHVALKIGGPNSVVVKGVSHPLVMSDGLDKVVLKVDEYVTADGKLPLMLDFDVARSVFAQEDVYTLRPVVRGMNLVRTGSIHGQAQLVEGSVAVFADNGVTQYTAYADRASGEFLLRGLVPGSYTVMIYYPGADRPEVYGSISVQAGAVSELRGLP